MPARTWLTGIISGSAGASEREAAALPAGREGALPAPCRAAAAVVRRRAGAGRLGRGAALAEAMAGIRRDIAPPGAGTEENGASRLRVNDVVNGGVDEQAGIGGSLQLDIFVAAEAFHADAEPVDARTQVAQVLDPQVGDGLASL